MLIPCQSRGVRGERPSRTICQEQIIQLLHFPQPFLLPPTGWHIPILWWGKDQDVWKGAYHAQAAVTARLAPIVLPEGLRKTSQTNCALRTYRQPIISLMAKVGEDPQVFPLYILHCFGRQNTTETIPLVDKGHTDFILAEAHKTQHLFAFTLRATSASKSTCNFFPQWKSNFYRM